MAERAVDGSPPSRRLDRVRRLARLYDAGIRVPWTRWEFGLDPLLGLVPGVGDVLGAAVSTYILVQAARCGASGRVLVRMLANVAVDALIGSVPVVGDLFDAAWKANLKNVRLLERYLADPHGVHRASGRLLAAILVGVGLVSAAAIVLALLVLRAALRILIR
jgi:Domain of unknown function (DUF4112)